MSKEWEDQYISVDGVSTHYIEAGEGNEKLLLIHGGGETSCAELNFGAVMANLGSCFHVIALDVVGYGLTPGRGPRDYPSSAQGDFIIDFMRTLGVRTHLGGNSHGGWLVQYVAHEAPDLVRKLIIINSGAGTMPVPFGSEGLRYVHVPEGNARPEPTLNNVRTFLHRLFFNPHLVTDERVQRTYQIAQLNHAFSEARGLATSATVTAKNANLNYRGAHIAEHAHKLDRPVLLTWSRENIRVTPADAMHYFNRLEKVEMHVFARAGHHVMVERPDRWSSVVKDFLLADI